MHSLFRYAVQSFIFDASRSLFTLARVTDIQQVTLTFLNLLET